MKSSVTSVLRRTVSTATQTTKPTGDISAVFPSLSGKKPEPLPPRFAELKVQRIRGKQEALKRSWARLLVSLEKEIDEIKAKGSDVGTVLLHLRQLLTTTGRTKRRVFRTCFRQGQGERLE